MSKEIYLNFLYFINIYKLIVYNVDFIKKLEKIKIFNSLDVIGFLIVLD